MDIRTLPSPNEKPQHVEFVDALVAYAMEAFSRRQPVVLLELLVAFPEVLLHSRHGPWILEQLRSLFVTRAYYAFAPLIGQRLRPERRKNSGSLLRDDSFSTISRAGLLRASDIPIWMRRFSTPGGTPIHVLSNQARWQPVIIGIAPYLPFFRSVSECACERASKGNAASIVEMLDVFPHYLHHIDKFPWLPKRLAGVFAGDFRTTFVAMRKRLGRKIATDSDLITLRVLDHLLVKIDFSAEEGASRIVPSGLSRQEAVDRLAGIERKRKNGHLTQQERSRRKKIDKQIQRARAKLKDYYGE
ncbi:hypothetical protein ACLESD_00235 [Pyxidicoccus sp. 3LFB2]